MLTPFDALKELRPIVPVSDRDEAVFTVRVPETVPLTPDMLKGWLDCDTVIEESRTLNVSETEWERPLLDAVAERG